MKIASKLYDCSWQSEEKKMLHIFNDEAKILELTIFMHVYSAFKNDHESALCMKLKFIHEQIGGFVRKNVI